MKNILRLLILVFFTGILLTACDSPKTSIPSSPATETPPAMAETGEHISSTESISAIITNPQADFTGEWNRTNIVMANSGTITIKKQTEECFDFSFIGFYGMNLGSIDGTAVIIEENRAEFKYASEYDKTAFAKVEFVLENDSLWVNITDGSGSALGFGHNVSIEGEYTKSEPIYLNADIINEILPTDEIKEKMCALLGEDVYEQMLFVIEYGVSYQVDGRTYSGFLSGAGEGVDLLIKDDKIYCLAYGLDADGLVYKLYTNDEDYQDKLPPFMQIDIPEDDLQFVYKP